MATAVNTRMSFHVISVLPSIFLLFCKGLCIPYWSLWLQSGLPIEKLLGKVLAFSTTKYYKNVRWKALRHESCSGRALTFTQFTPHSAATAVKGPKPSALLTPCGSCQSSRQSWALLCPQPHCWTWPRLTWEQQVWQHVVLTAGGCWLEHGQMQESSSKSLENKYLRN